MGKSRPYGANQATGSEMFNNTAVYEGPCLAMKDQSHIGKWQLYNIVNDPGQNTNLADKQPTQLQKMIADYKNYAQKVGIVVPTGHKTEVQYSKIFPPLNQSQTIHLHEIVPPFKPPIRTLVSDAVPTF